MRMWIPLVAVLVVACKPTTRAGPAPGGVSGTVGDGQVITITGAGFGAKSPAAPLKFDSFETTTNGGALHGVNGWVTAEDPQVTTVASPVRPNSTRAVRLRFNPSDSSHNFYLPEDMATGTLYVDYWVRFVLSPGSSFPNNYKMWRLYHAMGSAPNSYLGYAGGAIMQTDQSEAPLGEPPYYSWWGGPEIPELTGPNYGHVRYEFVMGADPSVGGTMRQWWNGRLTTPTNVQHAWQWRHTKDSTAWNQILFGNYAYGTTNGFDVYFDNVYLDRSLARVELCNHATYASATHCEIQIPSAWSATSIAATVNAGSFNPDDSAWLHITDSAGVQGTSLAVTIGAGSVIPPTPPDLITSSSTLRWQQPDATLSDAQGYAYKVYKDAAPTGESMTATCTAGTPVVCSGPFPAFSDGAHTLTLTATNKAGESAKSPSLAFTYGQKPKVPSAPTALSVVP